MWEKILSFFFFFVVSFQKLTHAENFYREFLSKSFIDTLTWEKEKFFLWTNYNEKHQNGCCCAATCKRPRERNSHILLSAGSWCQQQQQQNKIPAVIFSKPTCCLATLKNDDKGNKDDNRDESGRKYLMATMEPQHH